MKIVRSVDRPRRVRAHPLPVLQRLVDGTVGAEALTVWRNELAPGEQVLRHSHDVEEVLLVLTGHCRVLTDSDAADLLPGDAVIVPPGTPHGFRALGPADTSVVAVLASADPQVEWHAVDPPSAR
jgi:quercetin dioxygenase-like cupin family protein